MTTENTQNLVNDEIVAQCVKVNKSFLNGRNRVANFVKKLVDLDKGEIEANIEASLDNLTREDIAILDKAYQTASRRYFEDFVFGLSWDKDDQRGHFKIPKARNTKSDDFMRAINAFKKSPEDHDLTVKALRAIMKKHTKACKTAPAFEIDFDSLSAIEELEPLEYKEAS